jgi:hypothetical protein
MLVEIASNIPAPGAPLAALLEWWRALPRRADSLPTRQQIDPVTLPPASLPSIALVQRIDEADRIRWRYRLVGTKLIDEAGRNVTGMYVDELLTGDYGTYLGSLFDALMAERRPLLSKSVYMVGRETGRPSRRITRLMLPFTDDPGRSNRVAFVLGAHAFERYGDYSDAGYLDGEFKPEGAGFIGDGEGL